MSELRSVNDALRAIAPLDGHEVEVQGVLAFEFENVSLAHYPKQERLEGYGSSIWLEIPHPPLRELGTCLHGKRVVVKGIFRAGRTPRRGCGHMGLWPARIAVTHLRRCGD